MVHRAPDARLLTNLIANEKEYTKHLTSLFPLSHAALASLSAYAAASPAAPARTIAAIVDLLASADDALQRYNHAIETWREQLLSLKALEDDLSAVLRDRDILVTRLIKASKATREAHRSSRIMSTLGSASLSSLPSTNSTHYSPSSTIPTTVTGTGSSPASTNAKLAQAQAELQACEAHLVVKERELDARRISVARDGLGARCRALIDCGWVWGEMGKQGLRALQALTAEVPPPHSGSKLSYPQYASDNSSLTPSQSASQTAALSAETSHEGATSREHGRGTSEDSNGSLTLTLPPAHAISEFTVPTSVRSRSPQNGDAVVRTHDLIQKAKPASRTPSPPSLPAPVPRRRRTKRAHRPPSQHITEVSDEGSDTGPFPAPSPTTVPIAPPTTTSTTNMNTANTSDTGPGTSASRPFPTLNEDTSSDDDVPFQIVENDPFEVIRRSMLGPSPSVPLLPVPPGTHDGLSGSETSPSRAAFSLGRAAGVGVSGGTGGKRERRTSMAFFGSLKGLFKKPREREKARTGAEWDESPKPGVSTNEHSRGWVTRTDARLGKGGKGRGDVDSDDDMVAGSVKSNGGSRLRKGRPRGTNGVGVDGWVTDSPRPSEVVGASTSTNIRGLGRARTRRGMMNRRRTSVADLRGSEQGHTDGEVEGRTPRPLAQASSKARVEVEAKKVEDATGKLGRHMSAPVPKGVHGEGVKQKTHIDPQLGRASTTVATAGARSRKASETQHRSASLSVSPRAPPLPAPSESNVRPISRTPSPSPSRTPSPAPSSAPITRASIEAKKQQRRATGNGHAINGHVQNQSLMSIVADVTCPKDRNGEKDKTRSLDIPRAPGSVLHEAGWVDGEGIEDRSRGKRSSWAVGTGVEQGQGQGQGRGRGVVKMPLRSALRNASRTPSPSPAAVPGRTENGEKKPQMPATVRGVEWDKERAMSPSSFRDSMSVSSYATGRESLGEEEEERPEPMLTIPPPPAVDPPPVKAESTEEPLVRRKSVRVSLQPTFSPTPPALMDEEREGYIGWAKSEGRRSRPVSDMWADSSSEEEAYQRGRALLTLVGKSDAFKAKALKDKDVKTWSARR